jgi:hypothetical protein
MPGSDGVIMHDSLLDVLRRQPRWKDARIDTYRVWAPQSLDDFAHVTVQVQFEGDDGAWTVFTLDVR